MKTLLLLAALAYPAQSWVGLEPQDGQECRDKERVYLPGDTWHSENCVLKSCDEHEDGVMIHHTGCGFVSASGNCKVLPMDLEKLYPDCCPQVVCPDSADDKTNFEIEIDDNELD